MVEFMQKILSGQQVPSIPNQLGAQLRNVELVEGSGILVPEELLYKLQAESQAQPVVSKLVSHFFHEKEVCRSNFKKLMELHPHIIKTMISIFTFN